MPVGAGFEAGQQQAGGVLAGVGHVHVRIGAEGGQAVGLAQHLGGDVGVQVQAGDDGHGRADGLAHARQQLAFAVVQVLGDHGAVQVR